MKEKEGRGWQGRGWGERRHRERGDRGEGSGQRKTIEKQQVEARIHLMDLTSVTANLFLAVCRIWGK